MAGFLGIDHPLIVVRDIEVMRQRYAALGFTMTPIGKHPWGTSTSLAMFDRCLLELMSIYDERLTEVSAIEGFSFGGLIRDHLAEREGISMQALNSDDAEGDAALVMARGIACQGTIAFGREVTLPDGRADRTATTLKILHDNQYPRLSNFICQQHRPDLIYVPQWMDHPNGTTGICQVTILAPTDVQTAVRERFAGLYGSGAIMALQRGFAVVTGNGCYVVGARPFIEEAYGALPAELVDAAPPFCLAIHVRAPDLSTILPFVRASGMNFREVPGKVILTDAADNGNVFLVFDAEPFIADI